MQENMYTMQLFHIHTPTIHVVSLLVKISEKQTKPWKLYIDQRNINVRSRSDKPCHADMLQKLSGILDIHFCIFKIWKADKTMKTFYWPIYMYYEHEEKTIWNLPVRHVHVTINIPVKTHFVTLLADLFPNSYEADYI